MLKLDFEKFKGKRRETRRQSLIESPQEAIEQTMRQGIQAGQYIAACLFTEDGLLLAEAKGESEGTRELLAEIAIRLTEIRHTLSQLDNIAGLHEVVLETQNFCKIVFRIVRAFSQNAILAVIVPPHQSYRAFTNRLVKVIMRASFE